jgi:hypothetical protein
MRLGRKMIVTVKVLFQKAAFYWLKVIVHGTHRRITGGTQEDLQQPRLSFNLPNPSTFPI